MAVTLVLVSIVLALALPSCSSKGSTAETNENLKELEVGEDFTANVKLVYDAAKTGTILYLYNVKGAR